YSLYLWHWPLIVFTKLATSEPLTGIEQATIATAAVGLAILTWYLIEQPFRRRGAMAFDRRAIFKVGATGLTALAASAVGLLALDGMPGRFPDNVLAIAAAQADASPLRDKCHFHGQEKSSYDDTCVIGDEVSPTVVVYGDSHGAEFSAALGEIAKSHHASVRQITASGCPPAAGFSFPGDTRCEHYNAGMVDRLTSLPPATIVLATYALIWNREFPDQFWPGIERTIATLRAAGHRVILLGAVPDMPYAAGIPAAVARWTAKGRDPNEFSFKIGAKEVAAVDARLQSIAIAQGATFVPVSPELCSEAGCKPYAGGAVLYFDNNHLSMSGAQLMANKLLVPVIWPEPDVSKLSAAPPN
ncbi:MAG: SGNH hydrolase domain-containing protein, partial [Hyphomicrobium sp.]